MKQRRSACRTTRPGVRPGGRVTSFASPKEVTKKRRPRRCRPAARGAHAAGAEIGKRPKLAGAQTADASFSDCGAGDVSPSTGTPRQRQLQRPVHKLRQRPATGAGTLRYTRCASTQGERRVGVRNDLRQPQRQRQLSLRGTSTARQLSLRGTSTTTVAARNVNSNRRCAD